MSADPVRDFYIRNPYPPPVANLDRARDEWQDPNRHRAEYHLLWPDRPYRADLEILVAGCGTWQAAKYALCHPGAHVVGIDVSSTSLEHTRSLKRQYDSANLELRELPVERAGELGQSFDLVVCTGVLHHLADPDAGLRALAATLKPGGVILLMVYAPYGRAGVYMLQDYCRRLGIATSEDEISDLMTVLKALPPHHPLVPVLRGSRDAADPGALADALLNPRDRAYSVPQLFEWLDRCGVRFDRWVSQAPYLPQCGAMAATPHAERLARLTAAEQYAAMELWRGTLSTHSAVVSVPNGVEATTPPAFGDEARWPAYVPVRSPGTLCVQERLPPGAAGVLLSRYHSSTDLVLVIDAADKRMVEAIDGQRDLATIAARAGVPTTRARTFFETLYWYDQVVFDASRPA